MHWTWCTNLLLCSSIEDTGCEKNYILNYAKCRWQHFKTKAYCIHVHLQDTLKYKCPQQSSANIENIPWGSQLLICLREGFIYVGLENIHIQVFICLEEGFVWSKKNLSKSLKNKIFFLPTYPFQKHWVGWGQTNKILI